MDKQDLYSLDEVVYKQIQQIKRDRENETKAYIDGMEKGADMMMKAVRDFITKEEASNSNGRDSQ